MPTTNILKAVGLQTFNNDLNSPAGSLIDAKNINIDKDGVIEQRRGFKQYLPLGVNTDVYASQLLVYKDKLLGHYASSSLTVTDLLAYDTGSSFVPFSGTFNEVETGIRIKSVELNGNLYFTTSNGVKKISAKDSSQFPSITIGDAGGVRALDVELSLDHTTEGFLSAGQQVGYRIVWGIRDNNNNLVLGFPSPLNQISNSSTTSCKVKVKFYTPAEVGSNSNYFYQIYRTQLYDIAGTVTDELRLVYEGFNDGSLFYEITDVYSEGLRQANTNLYTNQYSGQGIAYANSKPPVCHDITTYKNHVFYGNTKARHSLTNTLLGISDFDSVTLGTIESITGTTTKTIKITGHGLTGTPYVEILDTTFDGFYQITVVDVDNFQVSTPSNPANTIINGVSKVNRCVYNITAPTGSTRRIFWTKHGLSGPTEVCIRGDLNGIFTATPVDDNSFDITSSWTITFTIGNNVVYNYNIQVTKSSTTNYYWLTGRQHKSHATFNTDFTKQQTSIPVNTATKTNFDSTTYITLYNLNDKIKYGIWFDATGTGVPPGAFDYTFTKIKVDLSSASITTANAIATAIMNSVSAETSDFDIDVTTNTVRFINKYYGSSSSATVTVGASPTLGSATITSGIGPSIYKDEVITLYSAENKVKYTVWFYSDSTDIAPNVTDSALVGIDLSDTTLSTKDTICNSFVTQLNEQVFDFVTSIDLATNYKAQIHTASSGYSTAIAISGNGDISVGTLQNGIGLVNLGFTEPTNKKVSLLSSYDSVGSKNEETVKSLLNAINKNSNETVYGYYVSSSAGLPGEFSLESRVLDSTTFSLSSNSATINAETFNETLPQSSISEELPNRIYFSKLSEPDSVPLVNYFDVGPRDKAIKRIVGLRDSLFIFKEEGIYRLFGNTSTQFQVVLFDSSSIITATDSAAVLNNQIYLLTTQGVVRVSETGAYVISRPIEDVFTQVSNVTDYQYLTFGLAYEADRSYLLAVPYSEGDETSTRMYRFNTYTQCWTYWDRQYNCGIVHTLENKLYFGATEDNYVEVERKTLTRKDYADRIDASKFIIAVMEADSKVILTSSAELSKGDSIVQAQYLTLAQVTQLVNKLNTDPTLNSPTPLNLVAPSPYTDLAIYLVNLAAALNTVDPTPNYPASASGSNVFTTLQSDFNAIVTKLNASSSVFYVNYKTSTGTVEYEAHIYSKISASSQVVVDAIPPFIVGACEIHKGYEALVTWTPMHFGDPSIWKQVRESKIMFQTDDFEGGFYGFNTDIANDYEEVEFSKEGDGSWGGNTWGDFNWGGVGSQVPFRTLIPRQKQRCRFIRPRFRHINSRNKFAIFGISFTFEGGTERSSK
jgi:hypothetical protein